ncbi:COP9 signalosome (CSN) subunit [Coemansia sp. RSA 989]|nr:COP9 signalosome (CSN) subunit [Coemansia sp. RSA 1086]KAJ1749304.1 COP9 signalosome (CSN) subunit [Coemansia sp. RSA 1821]KAJ1866068.1 COP9 signalosome (CSN) subunit [Coemansia sp. RSA 989]KAJ1873272.1 COP9 signalosome (CSN) subunit [Coemansia sp. RSA 990]KAJ2669950.1 COP9 signalosome (CSN) subunit [Coemansia sp. RSA 1085]
MADCQRLFKAQHKLKALNSANNGAELAQVLQLHSMYTDRVLQDIRKEHGSWEILESRQARGVWDEIAIMHFRAAAADRTRDFIEAYKCQLACYNAFLRIFRNMTQWSVPVIYTLSHDLSDVAQRADRQLGSGGSQGGKLEEATRIINQGFSMCMTDREPLLDKTRKWGTFHMANILFSLYVRHKAYNLCDSMVRALKAAELPPMSQFPMSDQVAFKYYRGMLAFRNEKYKSAKDDLEFALEHCHRDSYNNKTRILVYLTPILMAEGKSPQSRLFRRYPPIKALYGELAKAARAGNLRLFDSLMQDKEQQLANAGTYIAVERVRRVVVRQLLRKIHGFSGQQSRVSFKLLCDGFMAAGVDVDVSEMESMLADLIFAGYLKGYLAHDHGLAVLSKQQPFPPLSSIA